LKKITVEFTTEEAEALRLAATFWDGLDDHYKKVDHYHEVMENLNAALDKIFATLMEAQR